LASDIVTYVFQLTPSLFSDLAVHGVLAMRIESCINDCISRPMQCRLVHVLIVFECSCTISEVI